MSQSRKASVLEAMTTVGVGYAINQTAQILLFPVFGINAPISTNIKLGLSLTALSLFRVYVVRRLFNAAIRGRT